MLELGLGTKKELLEDDDENGKNINLDNNINKKKKGKCYGGQK